MIEISIIFAIPNKATIAFTSCPKKKDKDKQYNNKKNVWYILSESKKEKKKLLQ